MKRAVTVLALLAFAPSLAAAQGIMSNETVFGPRIRITPYIGQAPTVSRTERFAVGVGDAVSYGELDVDLGSGPALGLSLEARLSRRLAAIVAGTYINRGQTQEYLASEGVFLTSEGSNMLAGKAALAFRLWEPASEMQLRRLTASIYAGPAWIYEMPSETPGIDPSTAENISHWAANVGVDANIPLGRGKFEIQLGLEDYFTFWNADGIAGRYGADSITVEVDNSHMILVRAGLAIRVQ